MKKDPSIIVLTILCLFASCKINISSLPKDLEVPTATTPAPTLPTVDPDLFSSSVISTESYAYSGSTRSYQLLKSQSGSKTPTYMQWIPNDSSTTSGVVIIYYPYESINWTGDPIDTKWFTLSTGGHPDEDGPYYNIATSSQINITPIPHLTAATNASSFTANNLHVLIVYGRYYSGTDVSGDVQAVLDGYRFLNTQTIADKTKIGIYSGSWGGVGVLYGSKAAAAYSLKPKAISLAYPVSDLKALQTYMDSIPTLTSNVTARGAYVAFYDPYERRLNKGTESLIGMATRYDKYSRSELASLDASLFIIHDDWDTLVPVSFTLDLFSTMTLSDKYAYFQRHNNVLNFDTFSTSHSQATNGVDLPIDYATALTWNYLFLTVELTDPSQNRASYFELTPFVAQFQYMKLMYDNGHDTTAFRKTLGLLCRTNLFMYNIENSTPYAGAFVLYYLMENYYQAGWSADPAAACAKLTVTPPF